MAGSKNHTNPLKRCGRLAWFFMRFRGQKALDDNLEDTRGVPNAAGSHIRYVKLWVGLWVGNFDFHVLLIAGGGVA